MTPTTTTDLATPEPGGYPTLTEEQAAYLDEKIREAHVAMVVRMGEGLISEETAREIVREVSDPNYEEKTIGEWMYVHGKNG